MYLLYINSAVYYFVYTLFRSNHEFELFFDAFCLIKHICRAMVRLRILVILILFLFSSTCWSLASARSAKEVERCYNNSLNCYTIEIVSFSSACCCCCCCFFICFDSENGVKNNKNFVFQALIGLREKCGIYTRWMVSACEISTHVLNLNRTIFFVHFLGQKKIPI